MRTALASAAYLLAGCGVLGSGEPGGMSNLPNRGLFPYEPMVLANGSRLVDAMGRLAHPSARIQSGQIELTFTSIDTSTTVWITRSADGARFDAPQPLSLPNGVWAYARGSQFAVAQVGDELWVLNEQGGQVASLRPGASFDEAGVSGPSIIEVADELWVYYSARASNSALGIARARFNASFELVERTLVLEASTGCKSPSGKSVACWDEDGVRDPEIRVATSGTGRTIFRLMFTGIEGDKSALGFAASFDGSVFEKLAENPILSAETSLEGPTNILFDGSYFLYYAQDGQILGAKNDFGAPAETF